MIPETSPFSLLAFQLTSLMIVSWIVLISVGSWFHGIIPLVAAAYDFSQSGPGEYFIEPSNEFYYIDADCTPHKFYATVEDPVKVRLSGDLSLSHFYDTLNNLR